MRVVDCIVAAPEDRRFVEDCLENDVIVLTVRRNKIDEYSSIQSVIDITGCSRGLAAEVVKLILKNN